MCEVPVGLVAIFGRVLAERREGKAVLNGEATKLEGLEELGNLGAAIEHAKGGSGDGLLCGSEVRDLDGLANRKQEVGTNTYTSGSLVSQLVLLWDLLAVLILGSVLCNRMMRMRVLAIGLSTHYGGRRCMNFDS
jgi:hypothetical protein